MEPSPSTFGGVCHAEAQCMVNYKYLDSMQARCLHHCMLCISDSVSVSVGVIKSLQIRFVGREVLYISICSVRSFLCHPLRRTNYVRAHFPARFAPMIWANRVPLKVFVVIISLPRIEREKVHV